MLSLILLVANALLSFGANAVVVDRLADHSWDGVSFYIAVNRTAIQERLDLFHSSVSSECGEGPKLFLPDRAVLPGLRDKDKHPVYFDVGIVTSLDFDDYLTNNPQPSVEVSGLEAAVTIPFLAASVGGPPVHALALSKFYERSRGDFPHVNTVYPYIPVNEIKFDDNGALVKNGSDELRLSFDRLNHPCKTPIPMVSEEFESFALKETQFGIPEPEFSFCDRHCFENDYCTKAARVRCDAHRHAPNVCQMWTTLSHKMPCVAAVEIQNITPGFRDFILLGDEPINILASESLSGNFSAGLKYPCQE